MPDLASPAWKKAGTVLTGGLFIVDGNIGVQGDSTLFLSELTAGDEVYYLNSLGVIGHFTVDEVTADDALNATAAITYGTYDNQAFPSVYVGASKNSAPVSELVTGNDGNKYVLIPGKYQFVTDGPYLGALYIPGPAVAAAIAGGWLSTAAPLTSSETYYTEDTFMQAPNSTPIDVVGQDGVNYHLVPYDKTPDTNVQTVPAPAVYGATLQGWTIP